MLVLLLLVTGVFLASCGGERTSTNEKRLVEWYELSEDAKLDTSKEITIKFWHRMGADSQALVQKMDW